MAMASSVAAMPHESTWRDPSRPTTFFNILIPPDSPFADEAAAAVVAPTPRRRQILERWAAAAEVPAAAPRRARDAELSALTSTTRPVAARAAVFCPRETSPAPSDASSTAAAELPPPGGRASSLIQKWREIEAVGPVTPRAGAGGEASDSDGSPGGRVGCIVKILSGASSLTDDEPDAAKKERSLSPPPSETSEAAAGICGPRPPPLLLRMVRGRGDMEELVARIVDRRRRELAAVAERHAVSRFAHKGRIQSMLRLKLLRQGVTVKDEVWTLRRPVRPIQPQSGPKVSTMRNYTTATDLPAPDNCSQQNNGDCRINKQHKDDGVTADEKSNGVSHEYPVNSDSSGIQQYDEQVSTNGKQCQEECANSVCSRNQEYSEASSFVRFGEQSNADDNQYVEDVSPSITASTLRELQSPSSTVHNLHEDNQSLNGSWEERALWMSTLGWRTPADSMRPESWHRDVIVDLENHNQIEFNDRPWILDSPNSWRSLCISAQADCHALSNNADICQLLESKKVSKSLESDFSNKMNHLMLKILHKQRQQRMIDDFGGYYEECSYWRQNGEPQSADRVSSAPYSLVPVPSHQAIHQQQSWQQTSFAQQHDAAQNFLEIEVMVRSEMAQIHHEMYELRKLVESCIESQVKIQHSIKEEVCSAVRQAVQTGLTSTQPNTTTARRGNCCICHGTQVDSVLYRCGHMCACFDCADQLKSSRGNCPICRSPIADVIRARPSF